MSYQYFAIIKGSRQGKFHCDSPVRERVPILDSNVARALPFLYAGSGAGSHTRQHNPNAIRLTVESGRLSQQLMQAFLTGEILNEVTIGTQKQAQEVVYQTVNLNNGSLGSTRVYCGASFGPQSSASTGGQAKNGIGKPGPMPATVHFTKAVITGCRAGGSPRGGSSSGKTAFSFELDYNDVQFLPPWR
jgi:hypothetical protein